MEIYKYKIKCKKGENFFRFEDRQEKLLERLKEMSIKVKANAFLAPATEVFLYFENKDDFIQFQLIKGEFGF